MTTTITAPPAEDFVWDADMDDTLARYESAIAETREQLATLDERGDDTPGIAALLELGLATYKHGASRLTMLRDEYADA